MKKLVLLLLLGVSTFLSAQNNTITPSEYISNSPTSKGIKLYFQENNRFQMAVMSGYYEQDNDSVTFHSDVEKEPVFDVLFANPNPKATTINIKFETKDIYSLRQIYIGIQNASNDEIEFKSLKEYLNISDFYREKKKELAFEIEKVAYLYLVNKNPFKDNTIIEKYEVPKNISEITIKYARNEFASLKLKGYFDQKTNEFIVSEGSNPITFIKNDGAVNNNNFAKPIEKITKKKWSYPGMKDDYANVYEQLIDTTAVTTIDEPYVPPYSFKHTISKSFPEALKSIENKMNKFLVVSFDNSKNAKTSFDNFIKDSEYTLSNNMYDGYDSEKDNFNFYLANEKDKNVLVKYNSKDNVALLFFNSNGDLIYHTNGTLYDNDEIFTEYNTTHYELKQANQKIKIDKSFSNKKQSIVEIKNTLKEITISDIPNTDIVDTSYVEPAVEVIEDGSIPADTIAAPAYDYSYEIKDKQNLYKLKTSKETIQSKWLQVIDFYSKSNQVDFDFVAILERELKNTGFSKALFNEEKKTISDVDFKLLDYVFKNYYEILKQEEKEQNEGASYRNNKIKYCLDDFFDLNTHKYENVDKEKITKILEYNKKYLELSNYNLLSVQSYLNSLKENNLDKTPDYVTTYSDYFNVITKENGNIFENLDHDFTSNPSDMAWSYYKESFSSLANTIAWHVVENSTDVSLIQKAIKWSEASLKVQKDNVYYLDTLAQLYYKNGEKQKAISTEEKAVEMGAKTEGFEQLEEYKNVLEKMKNGRY